MLFLVVVVVFGKLVDFFLRLSFGVFENIRVGRGSVSTWHCGAVQCSAGTRSHVAGRPFITLTLVARMGERCVCVFSLKPSVEISLIVMDMDASYIHHRVRYGRVRVRNVQMCLKIEEKRNSK